MDQCRPASHRQNPNDTIIFLILSGPAIALRCRFQYSVQYIHAWLFNFSWSAHWPSGCYCWGQTSDILIWLINKQISPLNVRIRSLSMGLRQVFLYSSSHGNAIMILIVNASHVAKWGFFPDRYRDDHWGDQKCMGYQELGVWFCTCAGISWRTGRNARYLWTGCGLGPVLPMDQHTIGQQVNLLTNSNTISTWVIRALSRIISISRYIQRQGLWLSVPWKEEIKGAR